MTLNIKALCKFLCATTFATTLAVAADPNPPTVISPTSTPYTLTNGIAPNGVEATASGIFFTQPFTDGLQPRGIYSITTAGAVTSAGSIPTAAGVSAENGLTIAPSPAGSGFTAGDKFASGVSTTNSTNDAVYKNGSSTPFIDGISATLSKHQTALAFDTVGSFAGALIVTHDTSISLYNSAPMLLATYTGPAGFVLQASTVAPLSYAACPGCIFVTAMPAGNINNPTPSGNGEILTVTPGAANGSAAALFATTTGIPEPESIQFVTSNSLSCTVGGFSYFASGYATDSQFNSVSTSGAILAWTPAQLTPFVGHYLVQNEEFSGPLHGAIYVDAGLATQSVFSDSTTATNSVGYQLEDTAIIHCPSKFSGCTVTQGGWGAPAHGNNPGTFLNSKFSTVFPSGVTIGGTFHLLFTSADAIRAFLPQGGPPAALTSSATNPTTRTSAGVFAGQVLALQLNVDLEGFGSLVLTGTGTSLDGKTVAQILASANIALGGGALPAGFTFSSLNDLIDNLNSAFDGCVPDAFATAHLH